MLIVMLIAAIGTVAAAATGYVWIPALLVGGAIVFVLFFLIRTLARDGFRVAWYEGTSKIKWLECGRCDGWGELLLQWDDDLGTTVLNKFPHEEKYSGKTLPAKYANATECPDCLGMGHRWTGRDDGPVKLPYPRP